ARHLQLYNLEAAATIGPAWVMAEWRAAAIDQIDAPVVVFSRWDVLAGYFLTRGHPRDHPGVGVIARGKGPPPPFPPRRQGRKERSRAGSGRGSWSPGSRTWT